MLSEPRPDQKMKTGKIKIKKLKASIEENTLNPGL